VEAHQTKLEVTVVGYRLTSWRGKLGIRYKSRMNRPIYFPGKWSVTTSSKIASITTSVVFKCEWP
jgi:hypothetical protein